MVQVMFMLAPLITLLLLSGGTKEARHLTAPIKLELSAAKTLEVPSFGSFGDALSYEDGNLYFHAATAHYMDGVILAVSPKKPQPTVFSLPSEFAKTMYFATFSVSRSGRVYLVAEDNEHGSPPRVFVFDANGQLSSQAELEISSAIRVVTLAVFDRSRNMFLSGYYGSLAPPEQKGKSYVAIIAPSGKVLREINSRDSVDLKTIGEKPTEASTFVADDGNLYWLFGGEIRVLQESGEILRTIKLTKPSGQCFATKIVVSQGVAAIWLIDNFKEAEAVELKLETIDVSNGHVTGLYYPTDALGNNAVNFTRQEGFVFLDSDNGRIRVLTAATH